MITHIRHTGIVVKNLETSLQFYQDILGFQVVKTMEEKGPFIETILGLKAASLITVKLSAPDGGMIELLCFKTPRDNSNKTAQKKLYEAGISHIALTVNDLDADYRRIKNAGARFISSPQTNPENTAKVAFCEDPHGNILELVQPL
jgi:catechol 2,3-dioxygenase-like lactoylglutathione lyase family enzyme